MRLGEAGEEVSAVQAVLRKVCPTYAKYKVGCVCKEASNVRCALGKYA